MLLDWNRFKRMLPGDIRREFYGAYEPTDAERLPNPKTVAHVIDVTRNPIGTFKVQCLSCHVLVHPQTTGPSANIGYHIRHPDCAWPT